MTKPRLPEIFLSDSELRAVTEETGWSSSLDVAESRALAEKPSSAAEGALEDLRTRVARHFETSGYAVIRGANVDGGRCLIVLSRLVGYRFFTYAGDRIVKRFRVSPWTKELSHSMQEGSFHTDGNVSASPPLATAIQCETDDPGGDSYAPMHVAFLPTLLTALEGMGSAGTEAITFLRDEEAQMTHARSPEIWTGRLVADGAIRYHPESLRIASRRLGRDCLRLERIISTIHQASLCASVPFRLNPGDVLLVSNRKALHYRGECSVRFTSFPTGYEARSIFVVHRLAPNA